MNVSFIGHSGFLVETERFYYLFDYEKGNFPEMDRKKPIFVLSSHSHGDHYNPQVWGILKALGMEAVRGILSDDIPSPTGEQVLFVAPGGRYEPAPGVVLTTFRSTDLGVAFLVEEDSVLFFHAGDLNDWVWAEETDSYNRQMTEAYRKEIRLLEKTLGGRELDAAFVVLDPRQETDYDRGMCYFLERIKAKKVYPMHCWGQFEIIDKFLQEHPNYTEIIQK